MDSNAVLENILPVCSQLTPCECFHKLFRRPAHYDSKDTLQYINFTQNELQKYQNELQKHFEKDRLFHQEVYATTTAKEVKCANDHFLETLKRFQIYVYQTQKKGQLFLTYFTQEIQLQDLLSLYECIGTTTEKSILLFNQPDSNLPTKNLSDVLDVHQICIFIFQQYFHMYNFGTTLYSKQYYNPKIHSFHFKLLETCH